VNNQGYWDYDHIIIQFENCIDVVKTLHPKFDSLFLFDHSCGNDRQQPDGLSVPKVNKSFGGAQPKMRKSKIESKEFLGPYKVIHQVGDYQHMVFENGDTGPFYLSDNDQEALKFDCETGEMTTKKRRKDALENDLRAKEVRAKGNRDELVKELCLQNDVPTEITMQKVKEGWVGKPKGMLQILWERGFIDPAIEPTKVTEYYTNDGKKDAFGNLIPNTLLRMMKNALTDFIEEETLLQFHGKMLGVIVDWTPKCHLEVAGEGIEYSWGCSKGKYCWLPLSDKRRKDNFWNSVHKCLDQDEVLTVERQRMFSKQARQYMLAYHSIEISKDRSKSETTEKRKKDVSKNENTRVKLEKSAYLVEKIVKKFKSHRGATYFDSAYIDAIVNDMKSGISGDQSTYE
jgi:hypothetical protein